MVTITDSIKYVGVNDHLVDLFEGQYTVPNGMSYNSYVILDDKIAVMDTVDIKFTHEWLDNLGGVLDGRKPDYLIVQHMEPDHSANITLDRVFVYPGTTVVASAKAFAMIESFFGATLEDQKLVVGEGDTLSLGKHQLTFVTAPMVHWPEVIVTYDSTDKVLFSADGFGKFRSPGRGGRLGRRSPPVLYRHCGQIRRPGAEPAEKGRRTGHRHDLPPPRPGAERGSGPLPEPVPPLVLLHPGIGRHRHRLHLGVRSHQGAVEQLAEKLTRKGCPRCWCTTWPGAIWPKR